MRPGFFDFDDTLAKINELVDQASGWADREVVIRRHQHPKAKHCPNDLSVIEVEQQRLPILVEEWCSRLFGVQPILEAMDWVAVR